MVFRINFESDVTQYDVRCSLQPHSDKALCMPLFISMGE